jgi:hypothetical protein
MLALTLACARCHNHKFDPIPTKDYYSIAGIFRSTIVLNGYKNRGTGGNKGYGKSEMLYPVAFEGSKPEADAKQRELASAQKRASQLQREMKTLRRRIAEIKAFMKQKTPKDPKERVGFSQKKKDAAKEQRDLQLKIRKLTQQLKKAQLKKGKVGGKIVGEFTMGVRDVDSPADCKLNVRGDPHNLGTAVPRGFVQVISTPGSERIESPKDSGRLELAKWIASPQNPMTARVMVNRIWSHLFGRGIVRTVDNFGEMGARPTHPQLLDHLALRFVDHGFSMKKMIRQIMLTHTYRLGNDHHAGNYEIDPDDVYLWRANQRRVDVEMLRDAILMVSGKLDPTPAQGSPVRNMNTGEVRRGESASDAIFKSNHRSVYLPIVRSYLPEIHQTFDFPVPSEVKGQREVTTVALQALYMMNSRFVIDQAKSAAEKLLSKNMSSSDRATRVYMQTVGRTPNADELRAVVDYVDGVINSRGKVKSPGLVKGIQVEAWSNVYQAMFAGAEFRYVY